MSPPLLELTDLRVAYGRIEALRGVSLSLRVGERLALIGANGAGKTTLLKAVAGLLPVLDGRVQLQGADVTTQAAHRRLPQGMALVPEGRGIFADLTVHENLLMGAYCRDDDAIDSDLDSQYRRFPRLAERREQAAGTLSGGEQQMLAIGRALMGRPRLLLLDEPSMGLAPIMVERIFAVLREVCADGVTLLLVEQNARLAMQLCERTVVLEHGAVSLQGDSAELARDPRVMAAYLGQ
ncbi:MAG: ABC transporter ATP-binding protein [Betaproteobacteria bacterium]|nr:ABC transporter ATP-binding protein [Betaproteobacteria bacterium]NDF70478.1 ABC transporter ATP-binding protein [Betaproteobacteria bacterium]